jgi:hypothetical protein
MLAQASVDPSGHWEGTVQLPNAPLVIEVDVTRNAKGELAATFAQPSAGVKGFPFSKVEIVGRRLTMVLKAGEQPSTFTGTLSEDGKSIAGDAEQAGEKTTFTLTRVGNAKVVPLPKSTHIPTALEGRWYGALDVNGKAMRMIITLANQPDGRATGTVMSPDGSGIEIPIGITVTDAHISLDVPSVGASFAGTLSQGAAEISGRWSQQGTALSLTFRRAAF